MDTAKVRELISELERDIESKVRAINALRALLASNASDTEAQPSPSPQLVLPEAAFGESSYIDLALTAIQRNENRPLSMKAIVRFIRQAKGNPSIERRSVEATIAQHLRSKGDSSKIVKVSPGMYGPRRFPRTEPAA